MKRNYTKSTFLCVCENTSWELGAPTEWLRSKLSTTYKARNAVHLYLCTAGKKDTITKAGTGCLRSKRKSVLLFTYICIGKVA